MRNKGPAGRLYCKAPKPSELVGLSAYGGCIFGNILTRAEYKTGATNRIWSMLSKPAGRTPAPTRPDVFASRRCAHGLPRGANWGGGLSLKPLIRPYSVVQWHQFLFPLFFWWLPGPLKMVFPKKGSNSFFPGSLIN